MPDEEPVPETIETIVETITAPGTSVAARFDDAGDAAVEPRQGTEFTTERLRRDMNVGFNRLDRKLDRVLETLTRTLPARRRS